MTCVQNLPLNNPVLIVEVLVNRSTQSEEVQDEQAMKFTLGKEDLMEVSCRRWLSALPLWASDTLVSVSQTPICSLTLTL